jgi:hypothetical protein
MFGSIPKGPRINLPKKFDDTSSKFEVLSTKYVLSSNFIGTIIQMIEPKLDSLHLIMKHDFNMVCTSFGMYQEVYINKMIKQYSFSNVSPIFLPMGLHV